MECLVCKKEAKHECPLCHKKFCEEHLFPENHRKYCKFRIDFKLPVKQLYALVIILIIIGAVMIAFSDTRKIKALFSQKETIKTEEIVYNDTQKKEIITQNLSFFPFLDNFDAYMNKEVTLLGRLSRITTNGGGGYFAYINDDYGNKITLSLQTRVQRETFEISTKEEVYQAKGTLRKKWDGLYIMVISLSKVE